MAVWTLEKQSRHGLTNIMGCFQLLGIKIPPAWQLSKRKRILYRCFSIIVYTWQLILVPIFFTLSYRNASSMKTTALLTSVQVAINVCILPGKIFSVVYYMPNLLASKLILDQLDTHYESWEEQERIQRVSRMCNRMVLAYLGVYGMYSMSTFVGNLISGQPPYSLFLPMLDWRQSSFQFHVQSFIEFLIMDSTCVHQAVDDVYPVIYIYIMRMHVQLLAERLRSLGQRQGSLEQQLAPLTPAEQQLHYDKLLLCVKHHQTLLSLLDTINPIISATMFVQFLITAACLGITLINIIVFADTNAKIASVTYFLAVIMQTSPCCYQATCLLHDCEDLSLAIFQCNWIGQSKGFHQLLLFFMHRAQHPMQMTAMKLFPINLNTNLGIAKFSFSLYTLIKKMNLDVKLRAN